MLAIGPMNLQALYLDSTYLRLYYDIERRCGWLSARCRGAQRSGKMQKGVAVGHAVQFLGLRRDSRFNAEVSLYTASNSGGLNLNCRQRNF